MLLAGGVWKIGGDVSEALEIVPVTVGNVSKSLVEALLLILLDCVVAGGPVATHEHADDTFDGVLSHFDTKAGRPVVAAFTDAV